MSGPGEADVNGTALYKPSLPNLVHWRSGKVRELYTVDESHILIVTTDRLSAFDVVLPDAIPGKGEALTAISNFWFSRTRELIANHLSDIPLQDVIPAPELRQPLQERSVIARRLRPLPVEAIVRGYLAGSGWRAYRQTGSISGIPLPAGLAQAAPLPEPIFTPSSKAGAGQHDEHISLAEVTALIGREYAEQMRDVSLQLYRQAAAYAAQRGLLIADSKFEFGIDAEGRLTLIDELFTPDSSRLWPAAEYRTGCSPANLDKQFVRDYLEAQHWDKRPPAPRLPEAVLRRTAERYRKARRCLLDQGSSARPRRAPGA